MDRDTNLNGEVFKRKVLGKKIVPNHSIILTEDYNAYEQFYSSISQSYTWELGRLLPFL